MSKLFQLSRQIHRLTALITIVLSLVMLVTGLTMKYPEISPFDSHQARLLHNTLSPYFAIILVVMITTGLVMYLTPWILKRFQKNNISS